MSRMRTLGYIFTGIFSLGFALIGYALTRPYLELSIFHIRSLGPEPNAGWRIAAYLLFILLGLLIGLLIGTFLYHRLMDIGSNLKKIPVRTKLPPSSVQRFLCWWPMPSPPPSHAGIPGGMSDVRSLSWNPSS